MVSSTTLFSDTVIFIRDSLLANLTDPLVAEGGRATDSRFVMTSYPDRPVNYPLITVRLLDTTDLKAGAHSEQAFVSILLEVRIWARNEKEKDTLTNDVYTFLRGFQQDAGEAIVNGLHNFSLESSENVDEPGKQGIKSRILNVSYLFVAG